MMGISQHNFLCGVNMIGLEGLPGLRASEKAIDVSFDDPLASMIVEHEDGSSLSEAGIYRARAAELRQEAKQTHWPDVRDRVSALAEEYDLLAKYIEQR